MRKNILVVMADQLTALALKSYGTNFAITPHSDALAAGGLLFKNAYSSSPLCTPARYAFMTGQYVGRIGGYDNAAYLPSTVPTFAHYLRGMGYRTALAGKMHFVGPDQLHGFEERYTTDIYPSDFGWVPNWCHSDERIDLWYHNMSSVKQAGIASITNQLAYDDEVGSQSLRAIYNFARNVDERPFCMVSSFIHPHDPYAARQAYWDLYNDSDIMMPQFPAKHASLMASHDQRLINVMDREACDITDDDILRARHAYFANVSYVDEWLGKLRAALVETNMADRTSIIFISDHGDMIGEFGLWYKMTFREHAARIPMIIHDPDISSHIIHQPVSQLDILPTLVSIANDGHTDTVDWIDPIDGDDLFTVKDDGHDRHIIGEYFGEGLSHPMLMVRNNRYKYIQCPSDDEQLFDMHNDPYDTTNIATDSNYAAIIADMRQKSHQHWAAYGGVDALRDTIISDQRRRRLVSQTLRYGQYTPWDYTPTRNMAEEYTRSHLDLTNFDIESRYPRPPAFIPKY